MSKLLPAGRKMEMNFKKKQDKRSPILFAMKAQPIQPRLHSQNESSVGFCRKSELVKDGSITVPHLTTKIYLELMRLLLVSILNGIAIVVANPLHDGKTNTGAMASASIALKAIKYFIRIVQRLALIGYRKRSLIQYHLDGTLWGRVANSVGKQIGEEHLDHRTVSTDFKCVGLFNAQHQIVFAQVALETD
jgi:hypothetical protein